MRGISNEAGKRRWADWWLWLPGLLIFFCCLCLYAVSWSEVFEHGRFHERRPLLLVVSVLVAASLFYFFAARRSFSAPPAIAPALLLALLCRLVLLFARPVQEDDIYRYIWDGRVTAAGLDPYLHSPAEVLDASSGELGEVGILSRSSPSLSVIVERVNNSDYVTVYPPLLQYLFALHSVLVPVDWSPDSQVLAMKSLLLLFDLGNIALLAVLLGLSGLPRGLLLLYAWCPLVLKEFSNSGHMDSAPIFFLLLALVMVLGAARGRGAGSVKILFGGLALGVAASLKFFPLVLVPLIWRRLGPRAGTLFCAACFFVPLLSGTLGVSGDGGRGEALKVFALHWENHAAFFLVLRSALEQLGITGEYELTLGGSLYGFEFSGIVARAVCGLLIGGVVILLARGLRPDDAPRVFLRSCFYALAALLLLGPLGFPWYFTWCVPLLPFVRYHGWLLLPGFLMVYYLGFWYEYRIEDEDLAGRLTDRNLLVSFGLFYLCLGFEWWREKRKKRRGRDGQEEQESLCDA
jgi:hypothetical protein